MTIKTAASGEKKITVAGDTVDNAANSWVTWLSAQRSVLVSARGAGAAGSAGAAPSPLMTATDGLAITSQMIPGITRSLSVASGAAACVQAQFVGDDGSIVNPSGGGAQVGQAVLGLPTSGAQSQLNTMAFPDYIKGYGVPGQEWLRGATVDVVLEAIASSGTGGLYTFPSAVVAGGIQDTTPLWHAARGIMTAWQELAVALSEALPTTGALQQPNLDAFWSAAGRLAATLDTVDQNPPPSTAAAIAAAFNAATAKASQVIADLAQAGGDAAGRLANAAGDDIGKALAAFFKSAGLPVLLVMGIAVYISIH